MQRILQDTRDTGEPLLAARAIPAIGSVYVWRLLYRTNEAYYLGRANTRFDQQASFHPLAIQEHRLIRKADALPRVKLFRLFTMDWARPSVHQTAAGWTVAYDDMRYAWPPDNPHSLWSVAVEFDRRGELVSVRRLVHGARRAGSREAASVIGLVRSVWAEIGRP